MQRSYGLRALLIALTLAFAGLSSAARADGGTISFKVLKAGWVIGASGGSGTGTRPLRLQAQDKSAGQTWQAWREHEYRRHIMAVNTDKLHEFLGRFVDDLGATIAAGNVVIGHRLGLYRALAAEPARAEELAERTETSPRYIEEWLRGQAAGGYVDYDPGTRTYSMTEEQAFALANPDGGVYIPGAFVLAQAGVLDGHRVATHWSATTLVLTPPLMVPTFIVGGARRS